MEEAEKKERLDVLLVKRNAAASREKAKAYIAAGSVFVNGVRETKASSVFPPSALVELRGTAMKYASRGGYKLEKAMEVFRISCDGKVCMDVGASAGGFTDCMLQNGASKVYAVDVGTGQLIKELRQDARVISMEKTNIRYLLPEQVGEAVDFVSVDVAFISLTKVLGSVKALMKDGAEIICLVKPQFEAGKGKVGKKGVVKSRETQAEVIKAVAVYASMTGFRLLGLTFSPIKGPEGNTEYLLYMRREDRIAGGTEEREDVKRLLDGIGAVTKQAQESL